MLHFWITGLRRPAGNKIRTAKVLGLAVSPALLAHVDEVIE
jgi:hypothetical protein